MDKLNYAFVLLLGMIFLSRVVNEKANKKLDQEKKAALVDLFSDTRVYTFGALFLIIICFFLSQKYRFLEPFATFALFVAAMLIFMCVNSIYATRRLKKKEFPDFYIKSFLLSAGIRFIGLIAFLAFVVFQ